MRVLVCTTANSGHFGPLVPLALACQSAGHHVVVAAPRSFAGQVEAAGFEHRPVADAPPDLIGPVFGRLPSLTFEDANELMVTEVFGRLNAQASWPGIVDIIGDWRPDVLLREPAEFGSAAAARSAGVAQATMAIGVSAMHRYLARLVAAPLSELDSMAGLPEGSSVEAIRLAPTFTCVPSMLDGTEEASVIGTGPIHRFRDESMVSDIAALPGEWGSAAHPLVYISFGTVTAGLGGAHTVYTDVLSAFADQPMRILLTTGPGFDPATLGRAPANAHVERWWPQRDVLPSAAAVVSHGGFGTTMAALAAGVPQAIVPLFAMDQHINAEQIAALGAGVHLAGGLAAVPELPDAVLNLLNGDSHRKSAQMVADEMAHLPPVSDMVQILEEIAQR